MQYLQQKCTPDKTSDISLLVMILHLTNSQKLPPKKIEKVFYFYSISFILMVKNRCNCYNSNSGNLPSDNKILGWCPAGTVLPHGEKVPL